MAMYDYECEACKHKFSEMKKVEERDNVKCPKCESILITRLLPTGQSFNIQGKGQYKTGMQ